MSERYGEIFRESYAVLHGGRPDEFGGGTERTFGEGMEEYLARTRTESLGRIRKRLLAEEPPAPLEEAHHLLVDLLANASAADETLAEQVRSYQCGQFQESVRHSDRLQELVVESQRMDRDLINALRSLPPEMVEELGLEL